jgi:hypothetical protein
MTKRSIIIKRIYLDEYPPLSQILLLLFFYILKLYLQ